MENFSPDDSPIDGIGSRIGLSSDRNYSEMERRQKLSPYPSVVLRQSCVATIVQLFNGHFLAACPTDSSLSVGWFFFLYIYEHTADNGDDVVVSQWF